MTEYEHATVQTPDGPFTVIVNLSGEVIGSGWTDDVARLAARAKLGPADLSESGGPASPGLEAVLDALRRYYAGEAGIVRRVPRAPLGTTFQRRVWDALTEIPPGEPLSYGELAMRLDAPRSVRAVASACARNPAALFAPCHRVVGKDGALTGFAFGVEIKRSLLEREGAAALA